MSGSVASKNLFEILGNDPDSEGEVKPPMKEVVKQHVTSKKKDVVVDAPATTQRSGRGGRKYGGNEGAFRDREAGREHNRSKPVDPNGPTQGEGPRRGGRGGARGGAGGGRGRPGNREYDRRSGTGKVDTEKQVGQGWGANTGTSEWNDETAAEAIAKGQATGTGWDPADPATAEPETTDEAKAGEEAAPEEPEQKVKTLEEYKAEIAAKKAGLGPAPSVRQANEGSRDNKKWSNAVPLQKEEEDLFAPKEGKTKGPKERKQKQLLDIDITTYESRGENRRGGRGGPRGGRGGERRGGDRGDRGAGRGAGRGGQGRQAGQAVNLDDTSAFPSLGA